MWSFSLPPPRPRRMKKPIEPGFTPEEIEYLENTLKILDEMTSDGTSDLSDESPSSLASSVSPDHHSRASRSPALAPLISRLDPLLSHPFVRSLSDEARLWVFTHPATVGTLVMFLATILLARTPSILSVQTFVGINMLVAGIKLLSAAEDSNPNTAFEIPDEQQQRTRAARRRSQRTSRRQSPKPLAISEH